MKHITFSTQHARISSEAFKELKIRIKPEVSRVREAIGTQYTTRYASINAPSDIHVLENVEHLANEKKARNPSMIVLVGIGGSNLGAVAILEALYGQNYNDNLERKFYCADTVDTYKVREIAEIIEGARSRNEQVLLIIVSKSGSTIETISNAAIFINILKKHDPKEYHHSIVAITQHGSTLWYIAEAEHWSVLEVPMLIGGRYSVFSPVGLFPLAVLDININKLQEGAVFMRERCIQDEIEHNPAAYSALFLYHYYQEALRIHDTFLFSPRLEGLGKWYRQLLAESLGKKQADGNPVGITPTVSIGSTDLHSMVQLYLGGPRDRCTTFVWIADAGKEVKIPSGPLTDEKSPQPFLHGKALQKIMEALYTGTLKAYQEDELPFISLQLPDSSPQIVAAFMQMKMMEVMYLGYLLDIDPFDQPDVEKYKAITKELLAEK